MLIEPVTKNKPVTKKSIVLFHLQEVSEAVKYLEIE